LGNNHFKDLVSSGAIEIVKNFEKERKKEKFKRRKKTYRYGDDDDEEEDERRSRRNRDAEREDEDEEYSHRKSKKHRSKEEKKDNSSATGVEGAKQGGSGGGAMVGYHYGPGQQIEESRSYRDRAAERREGYNPDYDDDIQKMVEMDIEKSKYLGGDVKHTHLVRGLDFALLNKVKQESLQREQQALEAALNAQKKAKGKSGKKKKVKSVKKEVEVSAKAKEDTLMAIRTKTSLGKGLQLHLSMSKVNVPVVFKQISFDFDLDPMSTQELPTTVSRSIKDMADEDDTIMTYCLDQDLSQRIEKTFSLMRQGLKAGRRKKRKDRHREKYPSQEEKPRKAPIVDRVGDIYEDAGKDYIPAGSREEGAKRSSNKGNYFSDLRAKRREEVVEEQEERDQRKKMEIPSISSKSSRRSSHHQDKEKKVVHRDPLAKQQRGVAMNATAEYDDIYPTTGDFETYDSDEDLSKMDPGTTKYKKDLKPWDFDNDQEWEQHKANREVLPKAAFQFGVKMSDGRKTRRVSKPGKKDTKTKLDYEMNQINKILKGN